MNWVLFFFFPFIFEHTMSLSYSGAGCWNTAPKAITAIHLSGEYSSAKTKIGKIMNNAGESTFWYNQSQVNKD